MNWYKQAQLDKESGAMGKAFMGLAIPAIALMLGSSILEVNKEIEENPQQLTQQIQNAQQTQQQTIEPDEVVPEIAEETTSPTTINLDKIWEIESSRGKDPDMGKSTAGARGHFQFMEKTWNELVQRMGKNWDWVNGSMDYNKSSQVAEYYLNDRIPYMLNYYDIPDTIETRLGAYDWGIGYLREIWKKHGEDWLEIAPQETKDYINKYR